MRSPRTAASRAAAVAAFAAAACVLSACLPATQATADAGASLRDPDKKEIAMELVSSAENSTLDWRAQYGYIEDIGDGRGFTGGIIGFTSGTGDMLELVERYTDAEPDNPLASFIPALRDVNGSADTTPLGAAYVDAWEQAADDATFQDTQDELRDEWYFEPAVAQAEADGLSVLGQFIYYDAIVVHGPGDSSDSFGGIRAAARASAATPTDGGDEVDYLNAFLDARTIVMKQEEAHADTSRIDDAQRVFLNDGNFDLDPPLSWHVYGDAYSIDTAP